MTDPTPDEKVDGLFRLFTAYYGHEKVAAMWRGADLNTVRAVWRNALVDFDGPVMRMAVDRLRNEGSPFPPGLPEFIALCRESRRAHAAAKQRRIDFAALPPPLEANPEASRRLADAARVATRADGDLEWARRIERGDVPGAGHLARTRARAALVEAGEIKAAHADEAA